MRQFNSSKLAYSVGLFALVATSAGCHVSVHGRARGGYYYTQPQPTYVARPTVVVAQPAPVVYTQPAPTVVTQPTATVGAQVGVATPVATGTAGVNVSVGTGTGTPAPVGNDVMEVPATAVVVNPTTAPAPAPVVVSQPAPAPAPVVYSQPAPAPAPVVVAPTTSVTTPVNISTGGINISIGSPAPAPVVYSQPAPAPAPVVVAPTAPPSVDNVGVESSEPVIEQPVYNAGYDAPPPSNSEIVSPVASFESQLSPYGSWYDDPTYGRVFTPSQSYVGMGFTPYLTNGRWAYTDEGYVWISDYPWANNTFHYGQWVRTSYGWSWVPGTQYAPAWVDWRTTNGFLGWAPSAPRTVWRNGVQVYIGGVRLRYVFAHRNVFFTPNPIRVIVPPTTSYALYSQSVRYVRPGTTRFYGPPPAQVGFASPYYQGAYYRYTPTTVYWRRVSRSSYGTRSVTTTTTISRPSLVMPRGPVGGGVVVQPGYSRSSSTTTTISRPTLVMPRGPVGGVVVQPTYTRSTTTVTRSTVTRPFVQPSVTRTITTRSTVTRPVITVSPTSTVVRKTTTTTVIRRR